MMAVISITHVLNIPTWHYLGVIYHDEVECGSIGFEVRELNRDERKARLKRQNVKNDPVLLKF